MPNAYDDEDDIKAEMKADAAKGRRDFDCPSCNANNPTEAPIHDGEEVLCNYCGSEFRVAVADNGRMRFREM